MIRVYVWMPGPNGTEMSVGHSSLWLTCGTYISWWPQDGVKLKSPKSRASRSDLTTDKQEEGRDPDWRITIKGLNEGAILNWWEQFGLVRGRTVLQGPLPAYQLYTQNCSTVVALALRVGGSEKYLPLGRGVARALELWTPIHIMLYAQLLSRLTQRAA